MDNKAALADTPEAALEVVSGVELNQSTFDAIVKFSEQTEKIGKALDRVRTFFFSRAYSGDFVTHNGKTVNVSGPGAERILSSLGLMGVSWSLSAWDKHKDEGSDKNGAWYTHWYSAEAQIGNMRPGRLEGRASSRDKLFGFKNGQWKDLSEVKEPDIQMAARRCVYKELVRIGLGLRNIPIEEAVKMGLAADKIAKIEFGIAGVDQGAAPAAAGKALKVKSVTERTINKKDGSKSKVYVIEDENGAKYETFSDSIAKAAKAIKEEGKVATFDYEPNGNFAPKLKAITDAGAPDIEQKPDEEPQG